MNNIEAKYVKAWVKTGEFPPEAGLRAWSADRPICTVKVLTPNSIPTKIMFAQKPIAYPIRYSLNSTKLSAGTEFGVIKLVLIWTIGNKINAIAAASQTLTCAGIGYVENKGADEKSPDNLVNIAMNNIILLTENRTSRLNTIKLLLVAVSLH